MNINIRHWRPDDKVDLFHMIVDCLEINYQAGADMEPTFKNADALLQMGLLAAGRGEPCLVADARGIDTPGPIGYTLWCDLPNPLGLDMRGRVLYGLGTYVMERFQKAGVSTLLRDTAEAMGRNQGFTKVVGVAYHPVGLTTVLKRGYRVAGQHVEKELV